MIVMVHCSTPGCDGEDGMVVGAKPGDPLPEGDWAVNQDLEGWSMDGGGLRCPDCTAKRNAEDKREGIESDDEHVAIDPLTGDTIVHFDDKDEIEEELAGD